MIDATTNYINPYTNKFPSVAAAAQNFNLTMEEDIKPDFTASQTGHFIQPSAMGVTDYNSFYKMLPTSSPTASTHLPQVEKVQSVQYPPQPSSTGSASPNSSMSASTSPSIFPSPSSSFSNSSSQSDFSTGYPSSWNAYAAAATIPTRPQFSYAQYPTTDYYGNGMSMAASAAAGWFPTWSSNSTYGFNFEDIAFQTQLQRRSVRCTCPNCTNEMSGLPPIVGPDERGRKQHICHIPGCERLYGKASHLKTHLRWHTGERPFLCLTCGKRFSRSDELQRHGRTHTNYRPYSCPICSKKFSRSDHLSKHKKTHFKDKSKKKVVEKDSPKKDENANVEKKEQIEKPVKSESSSTSNLIKSEFTSAASLSNSSSPSSVSSVSSSATINTTQSGIPSGYTPYTPWFHQSHNPQNNLFSSSSTTTATPPQETQQQQQQQQIHQPQTTTVTSPEMMTHHHHHHTGHHQHQFPSYPPTSAYGDYSTSTMGYHPWTNFHATA